MYLNSVEQESDALLASDSDIGFSDLIDRAGDANSYLLAGNPTTSLDQLSQLMTDSNPILRRRVAENPRVPATFLAQLANDESSTVRISVAENPATPVAVLELLAEDDNPDVRFAIAENANMPPYILRILSQDSNPYVVHRATRTIERVCATIEVDAPSAFGLPTEEGCRCH